MRQETLCASPVELFTVSDTGASASKGPCVCAIVGLPSRPPKYSLVCYNAQQVTFCVARMSYVDGHTTSLRLMVHAASGHISFSDDGGQRWSLYFADAAQQQRFLACCGVAFYALFGAPATSVFSHDVSLPSSSIRLAGGDRAHVSFSSYTMTEKGGLCTVGALVEQRGGGGGGDAVPSTDALPYIFAVRGSAAQLTQGSFGFEGSVLGMREEDVRVLVVPAGFTTAASAAVTRVSTQAMVFVTRLERVEHVREEPAPSAAAAPPSVYAATADVEDARTNGAGAQGHSSQPQASPSDQALVVLPSTAAGPGTVALSGPSSSAGASAVPAFLSVGGIPPEHMSVLRKVELGVHAAVSTARDVHDVTAIFAQDWRRHVERPKPSLLSNRALLEQVQRVVEEDEGAQASLDECDAALQSLESRNKALQQRIDRATVESQKLLEEKNNAATRAMEARLERDRHLVKLKDTLLVKRQEQEDLQRHIAALQRTVDARSEELRQVQGRFEVHQVEAGSMAERLSAMQATLSEERQRNASLVAKSAATEEAIKKAQTQHRLAEGQLTAARGLAERERLRYLQVMEEERSHRAKDGDLLRQDIVHELDARDRQYQVERHRLAEEEFMRGLRDGKMEGRHAAETDLLGHQDELRLTLQRAKTEVETHKEEVRRSIEAAIALRRTLGGKAGDLEAQLTTATRRQSQLQFQLAQWQTRCRTARDTVSQHWRTLLSHATHPCTRDGLNALMEAVRAAEAASDEAAGGDDDDETAGEGNGGAVRVDLQFQQEHWRQSRTRAVAQRQRWLAEDMMELYVKGADYHFAHEWLQPLSAAHDATLEAVAQLYTARHGSRHLFDCCTHEAQERWAVTREWWTTVQAIESWLAAQRTAQESLKSEESVARQALCKAYVDGGDAVVQLCAAQLRAQVRVLQEEMEARDELAAEEATRRGLLPTAAQQQYDAACASRCRLLAEEEEAARAGLEAEAYTAFSGLQFQAAYALRTAQQLSVQNAAQQSLMAEETAVRQTLRWDATDKLKQLHAAAMAAAAAAAVAEAESVAPFSLHEAPPGHPEADATAPPLTVDTDTGAKDSTPGVEPPPPPSPSPPPVEESEAPPAQAGAAAPLHSPNPSTPPPLPPPATPAAQPQYAFADPPRAVHGNDVLNRAAQPPGEAADPFSFSTEPPPLPPSDDDGEDGEVGAAALAHTGDGRGQPAPAPSFHSPPPPPRHHAAVRTEKVVSSPLSFPSPRDAPPPLPPDSASRETGHPSRDGSASSSLSSSSSSSFSASTAEESAAANPRAAPPRRGGQAADPLRAAAAVAAAAVPPGDHNGGSPLTSPPKASHAFGGSSSDNDGEGGDARSAGPAARSSPMGTARRGVPAAAAGGVKKRKLFDSSDEDDA